MSAASVLELQRAWQAIQAGQFSDPVGRCGSAQWSPSEPTLPVLGVQVGYAESALALALATQEAPARVVECASGPVCGLAGAAAVELGPCGSDWSRGLRDDVVVDHCRDLMLDATEVPPPVETDRRIDRTVVAVGWDPTHLLGVSCWLTELVRSAPCVVLVTAATLPGLRRLENTISLLGESVCVAAVVGRPVKRWPRTLAGGIGGTTRRLIEVGRLVSVPASPALRVTGITPAPLPQPLLAAANDILRVANRLTSNFTPETEGLRNP